MIFIIFIDHTHTTVMAHVLKFCRPVLDLTRSSAFRPLLIIEKSWVRYYPTYKKHVPEEDMKEMKEYRENMMTLRRQFREQWRAKVCTSIYCVNAMK